MAGPRQLSELEVSALDRLQIDRGLAFIDDISGRIKDTEATIKTLSKDNANVRRLKTISGIGECFARLIDAEIDDEARFRPTKKLAAYVGIVPSTYSSGGKTWRGRITKQGKKRLRWAFIEAVAPAVATDPELKELCERLKAANRAKVAVARRLLTIAVTSAATLQSKAHREFPGCPDAGLAGPAAPGRFLRENGKPGPKANM